MKAAWIVALLVAAVLQASDPQSALNINSRYVVERVDVSDGLKNNISRTLREDLESLVGEKLNQAALDKLSARIRKELRARHVTEKITKGTQPEHVIVLFEVTGRQPESRFDLRLPRGLYHAKQGWSGAMESKVTLASSEFSLGIVSDGDRLLERFAGVRAGYTNTKVGSDRVHLGFQFASYHEQWNPDTLAALDAAPGEPGIYRTRQDFAPSVTFVIAEPLTVSAGVSFERLQTQFPAAHTEAANAVTTTLRYARRLEDSQTGKHDLSAGYSLRAATKIFDTDFVYSRHQLDLGYVYSKDRQTVAANFTAGRLTGRAPLFERFVAGNASTLRGWNKFEISPLGGSRLVHGSLEYRYQWFGIFYDTGTVWNQGEDHSIKHSLGLEFRTKGGFFLALAFPIRSGRAEPVFMAGFSD